MPGCNPLHGRSGLVLQSWASGTTVIIDQLPGGDNSMIFGVTTVSVGLVIDKPSSSSYNEVVSKIYL